MLHFLRQSINFSAILQLRSLFYHPSLVIPDYSVNSLSEISMEDLYAKGIRGIVFDKDNTLSISYENKLHPSVVGTIQKTKAIFKNRIAILSNSVGSSDDDNFKGAVATEKGLGLPVIRHIKKKPACIEEVLQFFNQKEGKALSGEECLLQPAQICVVGDRVLTDVVFANTYGMTSILVRPLSIVRDHPVATIFRFLEYILLLVVYLLKNKLKLV